MTATLHVSIFRIGVCVALVTVILGAADLRAQTITHEYQAVILHPPGVRNSQAVKINWSAHEVVGESWAQALDEGQALEWTGAGTNVVSLSPGSRFGSRANGISGNQVGGTVSTIGTPNSKQAMAWATYSPFTATFLHPANMAESAIFDAGGGQFVGWAAGQSTSSAAHAMLWTSGEATAVIDLNPSQLSFVSSVANSVDRNGRQQVGSGTVFLGIDGNKIQYSDQHALLWSGNAASAVDLHPAGFSSSVANAAADSVQVGSGFSTSAQHDHALLWTGTASSAIDLNPSGITESMAGGIGSGGAIVGWVSGQPTGNQRHAFLWLGASRTVVDLHNFLPAGYISSVASGIDDNDDVVGWAITSAGDANAVLWRRLPDLQSISFPGGTNVYGGGYARFQVALNGPAIGDAQIQMTSSNPSIAVLPAYGTLTGTIVPSGSLTRIDGIRIIPVATQTQVTITATYRNASTSVTLTILPATLASITMSPYKVVCGQSSVGTVMLNAQAGPGGAIVQLAGSTGVVSWPASVTIPAYSDRTTFSVRINAFGPTPTGNSASDTVTATYRNVTRRAGLQCSN
ncbi:MAG TPA: hypothetical protein VE422_09815 [Terriglobia bacterium]|nr:hypothetical protein [Terriglobia bacterium]